MGYAHNTAAVSSTQSAFPTYSSWYVGGGVDRPLGKNFNPCVAYSANISVTSESGCTGSFLQWQPDLNSIYVNLQWHGRPMTLP